MACPRQFRFVDQLADDRIGLSFGQRSATREAAQYCRKGSL
jgi:hypothetical protein